MDYVWQKALGGPYYVPSRLAGCQSVTPPVRHLETPSEEASHELRR